MIINKIDMDMDLRATGITAITYNQPTNHKSRYFLLRFPISDVIQQSSKKGFRGVHHILVNPELRLKPSPLYTIFS